MKISLAAEAEPVARPIRAESFAAEGLPMTTTTTHHDYATTTTPSAAPRSSAITARRGLLVAAPVLAAAFTIVGAVGDPAAGINGSEMLKIYIENPSPLQWKSTGYHWAYAFWILPAFLGAALVRGKGAWLANVAAMLAFAGMVTLPGMLITDWYASAIGHEFGLEGTQAVESYMESTMWGVPGFGIAAMAGFVIGVPLSVVALIRGGLVRWWTLLAVIVPLVALFVSQGAVWGGVICAAGLLVWAYSLRGAVRKAFAA
jgi:hypothetical protein